MFIRFVDYTRNYELILFIYFFYNQIKSGLYENIHETLIIDFVPWVQYSQFSLVQHRLGFIE